MTRSAALLLSVWMLPRLCSAVFPIAVPVSPNEYDLYYEFEAQEAFAINTVDLGVFVPETEIVSIGSDGSFAENCVLGVNNFISFTDPRIAVLGGVCFPNMVPDADQPPEVVAGERIYLGRIETAQPTGAVLLAPITEVDSILNVVIDESGFQIRPSLMALDSIVEGSQAVDTTDTDGDLYRDYADNCVFFPNSDQTDSNVDGRGDACQCGDGNGDGLISNIDIATSAVCAVGRELCDSTIVDADGDASTTALDIGGIVLAKSGVIPSTELQCQRAAGF